MPAAYQRLHLGSRPEPGKMPDVRFLSETKKWRPCNEDDLSYTRAWRDSRNRCDCEPDGGGRSVASSWLSRRPHCRRLGGRGHSWRRASANGILQLRVPTRRLCRGVMLRPARTDLGRMALAHSPRGGMLLTKAAFNRNVGKEDLALLWQILSGTGFPHPFFCDSWEVGFWRGRPWLAGHRIGRGSLDAFSSRFWIGLVTRRGAKCVRFTCLG